MQLSPDNTSIENALAEFVQAAFSPEERQIAKLKARLEVLPPRSEAQIIVMREMMEARLRQFGAVL
ncbi:MAG TPA: hypothetical protein VN476_16075 [Pyrinomonadaceae bacterium]|nr:hypothetical protein [Pyrinomonadaceae bacterium]